MSRKATLTLAALSSSSLLLLGVLGRDGGRAPDLPSSRSEAEQPQIRPEARGQDEEESTPLPALQAGTARSGIEATDRDPASVSQEGCGADTAEKHLLNGLADLAATKRGLVRMKEYVPSDEREMEIHARLTRYMERDDSIYTDARAILVKELAHYKSGRTFDVLRHLGKLDPDALVRLRCLDALAAFPQKMQVMEFLAEVAWEDPSGHVRVAAVGGIGEIAGSEPAVRSSALEALMMLVRNQDEEVAASAAYVLIQRTGVNEAESVAREILSVDERPRVRLRVEEALERLGRSQD